MKARELSSFRTPNLLVLPIAERLGLRPAATAQRHELFPRRQRDFLSEMIDDANGPHHHERAVFAATNR